MTSKDRNLVQPSVLDGLGWNLIRVWSFDYLDDPSHVVELIKSKVEDIRLHRENYKHQAKESLAPVEFEKKEIERANYGKPYVAYSKVFGYAACAYDASLMKKQIVKEIMELEAPIEDGLLQMRFASALGMAHAGSKSQRELSICLTSLKVKKNQNPSRTKTFYWREDQCENGKTVPLTSYRYDVDKSRPFDATPKEEILVAIKEVLTNDGAMFKEELKKRVSTCFQIKALTKKSDEIIDDVITYYLDKKELVMIDDGSRVALKGMDK